MLVFFVSSSNSSTSSTSSNLFVWFVAVASLLGISFLANLILIYLAFNQASRSALWRTRIGQAELLLGADEDDNEL